MLSELTPLAWFASMASVVIGKCDGRVGRRLAEVVDTYAATKY